MLNIDWEEVLEVLGIAGATFAVATTIGICIMSFASSSI